MHKGTAGGADSKFLTTGCCCSRVDGSYGEYMPPGLISNLFVGLAGMATEHAAASFGHQLAVKSMAVDACQFGTADSPLYPCLKPCKRFNSPVACFEAGVRRRPGMLALTRQESVLRQHCGPHCCANTLRFRIACGSSKELQPQDRQGPDGFFTCFPEITELLSAPFSLEYSEQCLSTRRIAGAQVVRHVNKRRGHQSILLGQLVWEIIGSRDAGTVVSSGAASDKNSLRTLLGPDRLLPNLPRPAHSGASRRTAS